MKGRENSSVVFITIACGILIGCSENSPNKIEYNEFYPNGKIEKSAFLSPNGQLVDTVKYFYENGTIRVLEFYKNGMLNGEKKVFYHNGLVAQVSHFVAGRLQGRCINYTPSGSIESVSFFLDDKQVGDVYSYIDGILIKYNFVGFNTEKLRVIRYDPEKRTYLRDASSQVFCDTLLPDKVGENIDSFNLRILLSHPPKNSTCISVHYYDSEDKIIRSETLDSTLLFFDIIKPIYKTLKKLKIEAKQYDSVRNHLQFESREILF
ncbi:MAG TPA: hypothetical protein PLQ32_00775 [Flavihumibacter sp.]|nr:hypothetical protein [Bacteroidota bacterium]HPZ86604.1 hypothetical protein [Flavihumibacter sp.]HQD08440.1 hypothetical protein [Flavihumibacter sp.]